MTGLGQKRPGAGDRQKTPHRAWPWVEIGPKPRELRARALLAREAGNLLTVETYQDHRFAMSFAVLGSYDLLGDGKPWLAIKDPSCSAKTFPDFFNVLESFRDA